MNNQSRAIEMLTANGYTASISKLEGCITVKDPVCCRRGGQTASIEYEEFTISVNTDMKSLFKFLMERE